MMYPILLPRMNRVLRMPWRPCCTAVGLLLSLLATACTKDLGLDRMVFECNGPSDDSCGPGCRCVQAEGLMFWGRCECGQDDAFQEDSPDSGSCTANDHKECCSYAVCWFDSCGAQGEEVETCPFGCTDAACCEPVCSARECGDNGCGGTCGSCPTGKTCNGSGLCTCSDDCSPAGNTECIDPAHFRTCDDFDSNGCLEWSDASACTPESACSGGKCDCSGSCSGKSCGDDGCGKSCGTCKNGAACNGSGQCVCTDECSPSGKTECTDSTHYRICSDSDADGCQEWSTSSNCATGKACFGGECVCAPVCSGKQCGDDGCGGSCGKCTNGTTCDGSGKCVCTDDCSPAGKKECTDSTHFRTCAEYDSDGCLEWKTSPCDAGKNCTAGTCACSPSCSGKQCGDDGCGGICGSCSGGKLCKGNQCVCTPQDHQDCCGDAVCWFDSCGAQGTKIQDCTSGCESAKCKTCSKQCMNFGTCKMETMCSCPAAPNENVCNGKDDDCDGMTDEYDSAEDALNALGTCFCATVRIPPGHHVVAKKQYSFACSKSVTLMGDGCNKTSIDLQGGCIKMTSQYTLTVQGIGFKNGGGCQDHGGAFLVTDGQLDLRQSCITGSQAWMGGAVAVEGNGAVDGTSVLFSGNKAINDGNGGAIYVGTGASAGLTGASFCGNSATDGGAVYAEHGSFGGVGLVFHENTASSQGGALYADGASFTMTNATFAWNSAGADGGGLYLDGSGSAVLKSVILFGNTAASCAGNICWKKAEGLGLVFSLISAGVPGDLGGGGTYLFEGDNLTGSTPMFVNASKNGSCSDNFCLSPSSPGVNAGNPSANGPDPDGSPADMGACGGSSADELPLEL